MRLDFLFDFGSPNAYLCYRALPAIEREHSVRFKYVPILLGGVFKATGNRSPGELYAGVINKNRYDEMEMELFCEEYSFSGYRHNPDFPINTLPLMRGAIAARRMGIYEKYVDEVFRCMWSDVRNMGDPEIFKRSLDEAGIDSGRLTALIQELDVKQELIMSTERAVEQGVFGAPTFFVGERMYFGKDRLHKVVADIKSHAMAKA